MAATAAERRAREARIAEIPWVKRVTDDKPCEGIKWGKVALKHLYTMGGRPAEGIPDRARCSFRAKWHFAALTDDEVADKWAQLATSGDYCVHHLFSQIYDHEQEFARYQVWASEHDRR